MITKKILQPILCYFKCSSNLVFTGVNSFLQIIREHVCTSSHVQHNSSSPDPGGCGQLNYVVDL